MAYFVTSSTLLTLLLFHSPHSSSLPLPLLFFSSTLFTLFLFHSPHSSSLPVSSLFFSSTLLTLLSQKFGFIDLLHFIYVSFFILFWIPEPYVTEINVNSWQLKKYLFIWFPLYAASHFGLFHYRYRHFLLVDDSAIQVYSYEVSRRLHLSFKFIRRWPRESPLFPGKCHYIPV